MKHIFFVFSILCSTHMIFVMDFDKEEEVPLEAIYRTQEQIASKKTNSKSLDELFDDFEKGIRESYNGGDGLLRRFKKVPLYATDYIKKCEEHLPVIFTTEELIEKYSHKKDSYFSKSIASLISRDGSLNLKDVTCDTLADIENPQAQQQQKELNALPLVLKKYVMDRAYQNLCNINPIHDPSFYDLHPGAGLMATVSKGGKGGVVQLWNLKTENVFHNFPEMVYRKIQFSNDGSYLVTVTDCWSHSDAVSINIWEMSSLKLLHTINKPGPIQSLDLCCRPARSERILTIVSNNSVELHSWRDDEKLTLLSHIPISALEPDFHNIHTADYTHEHNEDMDISKNNYRSFYLCREALCNTKNASSLPKIKDAPAYKILTKYEKEKIDTQFKRKVAQLEVIKQ